MSAGDRLGRAGNSIFLPGSRQRPPAAAAPEPVATDPAEAPRRGRGRPRSPVASCAVTVMFPLPADAEGPLDYLDDVRKAYRRQSRGRSLDRSALVAALVERIRGELSPTELAAVLLEVEG